MDVFDAAMRYKKEGRDLIILAGKDYGSGSSRDWAAKGPWMLVRKTIIIEISGWGTKYGGICYMYIFAIHVYICYMYI